MVFSPPSLLDLPTELKSLILSKLDVKSLLNMSITCKSINGLIHATSEFALEIEVAKSELIPAAHIRSSAIARRRLLQEYRTSRLTLPIETRHCNSIKVGSGTKFVMQRLFRGLLACITDNSTLHVWNIRHRPDSSPPQQIFMISETETRLMDVLIAPHFNLLVLLCYHSGNNRTIIKLLDLNSNGTKPHPLATPRPLTIPEEPSVSLEGRQLLTLYGPLLALVYCHRQDESRRRGIILDWRTGNLLHDSMNFDSTSNFHDLLLLSSWSFLVVASTPFHGPPTALGAWIELWICGSPASRLVAKFHLPEFDVTSLDVLQFFASEPPSHICAYDDNGVNTIFPFVSDPKTAVQVLNIWYSRTENRDDVYRDETEVYLVISNRIFVDTLKKLSGPNVTDNGTLPLRIEWDDWGPPWTSIWDSEELTLSDISSVCGSRIFSVFHPAHGGIELLVIDFNMNFPCTERDCTNPSVHLSPKSFRSQLPSLWAPVVHTWLPFHTRCKSIRFPNINEDLITCTAALMDEERIVVPSCMSDGFPFDPTSWTIIHMLRDRQNASLGGDHLLLGSEDADYTLKRQPMQHDRICRLCKEKPHTDPHILLECTTHPEVVQLRQNFIEHITHLYPALYSTWARHSFDELLDEIKVLRGAQIRILVSSLVTGINKIYEQLDPCSELVSVDDDNPASIYFITIPKFVPPVDD